MSDAKMMPEHVQVSNVDMYRSRPAVNMEYDMVRLTLNMPLWLWRRSCKYLNVDEQGWPLPKECCKLCGYEGPPQNCTCKED